MWLRERGRVIDIGGYSVILLHHCAVVLLFLLVNEVIRKRRGAEITDLKGSVFAHIRDQAWYIKLYDLNIHRRRVKFTRPYKLITLIQQQMSSKAPNKHAILPENSHTTRNIIKLFLQNQAPILLRPK